MVDSKTLLAAVCRSPEAAAVHDRQAWLDLFSDSGVVCDPVGTAPARKGVLSNGAARPDELGCFYDAFIAPNEVVFSVHQDIVLGMEVIRDVTIHTRLATGLQVDVPAYLRYGLSGEGESLRIESMQAHWQLFVLIRQVMGSGWQGIRGVTRMLTSMLRHQGSRGIIGYLKGMTRGIFGQGHRALAEFAATLGARDEKGFLALFEEDAHIEFPAGSPLAPRAFFHAVAAGAGRSAGIEIRISGLTSSGWWSSCVFQLRDGESTRHGVAFFCFDPRSKKLKRVQLYWNEPA